jgi:long-chain acyl-CoA synthetase
VVVRPYVVGMERGRGTLPSTTADIVRHWAATTPERPALRRGDGGGIVTFAELDAASSRAAQALAAAGVRAGDRVGLLDRNGTDQVELLFAAAKLNAVPTPINFRLAGPEVATIVEDSGARILFVGEDLLGLVAPLAGRVPVVAVSTTGGPLPDGVAAYSAWRDAHPATDPATPLRPDDVAIQLYSSGTTGRPKGVLLTQANLFSGVGIYGPLVGLGQESVNLAAMPLFHIGGVGWLLAGLAYGAATVVVRDLVPAELVETIEAQRVTHTFLVPAVLQFLLAVPGVAERDFSALDTILYGASPISETVLVAALETFGCRFAQVYGLTESTGTVSMLLPADHDPGGPRRHLLRSVGKATPGSELRVVDPATGVDVGTREVGEIWIRGTSVMAGYWNLPDATAEAVSPDGWLRSGDAGYFDEEGYLYIYDRVKDLIVSGGENIYPAEVENVLMAHPGIADAAVIGVPDERWGEAPLALLVRAPGATVTDAEVVEHCRARLAGFKCPRRVEWVETLPRNPSGKVLKKDLRTPYWAGRDRFVS